MDAQASFAEVREAQKRQWTAVADAWGKWFDWTERNFAPLTAWLRDATGWRAGANVLDIGCGSGYPSLAVAAGVAGALIGGAIASSAAPAYAPPPPAYYPPPAYGYYGY